MRSASSTGVEERELSLELSPPLLLLAPLESLLHGCKLPSPRWTWFTMMADCAERKVWVAWWLMTRFHASGHCHRNKDSHPDAIVA